MLGAVAQQAAVRPSSARAPTGSAVVVVSRPRELRRRTRDERERSASGRATSCFFAAAPSSTDAVNILLEKTVKEERWCTNTRSPCIRGKLVAGSDSDFSQT